jgi:ribosomal protein L11 methyltransferase
MAGFWQLSFELRNLDPQIAEQHCFACGATSVTFVDAGDMPVLEPLPGEFRLWPATRLRALFDGDQAADALLAVLSRALDLPVARLQAEYLEDRAWEREWLRDFHAMRFGQRLWVCPQHEQVAAAGAAVVHLDPGLAFGTGTHPSTALCLRWLDAHVTAGQQLIDYGCGSGILALAAVKLGVRQAYCFDIDPQALLATAENARRNDVTAQVQIVPAAASLPRAVDVLVANILSGPLCELAPSLSAHVRPDGAILLAGLMDHEIADVTAAYSAWFDMSCFELRDGWAALAGRRNSREVPAASVEPDRD